MTEKRFTSQRTEDYNFSDILDNGKWIGICHIDCEDDFVNKFNELAEENEELKQSISDWQGSYDELYQDKINLEKENKELLKEKIDVETKLYKANEQLLMQMDYDAVIKQDELKIINLKNENDALKQQINDIELNYTQNYQEFDNDKLYIKDNNTQIILKNRNLYIEVVIPKINEVYLFKYIVTGRMLDGKTILKEYSNGDK